MVTQIWVNTGLGNGLLPDSTTPLSEPMLEFLFCGIYLRAIMQRVPKLLYCVMSLKIRLLKLLPNLPGTNELNKVSITACLLLGLLLNSLAPGRFQFNFRQVIFKLTLVNGGWGISYEIALRWMPLDLTDDKSTLVQVMAWCHQATNHYMIQCWLRSLLLYDVTRPQWVKWRAILIKELNPVTLKQRVWKKSWICKIVYTSDE